MKRFVSILFLTLFFALIFTSCTGLPGGQATLTPAATPTNAGSTSNAVSGAINGVAMNYYQAIAKRNYTLAYSYLDPVTTKLSLAAFTQEARSRDQQEGVLQSYIVAAFPPMVVMTNMRVHIGPYHVHLQFKQEGSSWKIVSLDGV